jgi:peptidoglycan/LPS O-acetylase OafA/YrhL
MNEEEKRDRQMLELLNELRVALPGVQILFAFLLAVPFQQGFEKVTQTQKDLYFGTLMATCAATVCLIAPSAMHRLRFHKRDRTYLIESANRFLIAGLGFLGVAIVLAVILISDYLYEGVIVWLAPLAVAVAIALVWFGLPLARGDRSSGP